jgi:GDPmannose 4,6-dehydratase
MWLMLQQPEPDDYVIATGEMHSVREFAETAFALVGLRWRDHVEVDPRYFRPAEVEELCGDPSKAAQVLGWQPETGFKELVRIMLTADLRDQGVDPGIVPAGKVQTLKGGNDGEREFLVA